MGKYVLDACALIANLKKEEGWDIVENVIYCKNETFLHSVNLLEVYYDMVKTFGETRANSSLVEILKAPIKIIYSIDLSLIKVAGYFKANYRISLADSFVLPVIKKSASLSSASSKNILSSLSSNKSTWLLGGKAIDLFSISSNKFNASK
jgi:PIN domain nuclease of toxin-antitoxin system